MRRAMGAGHSFLLEPRALARRGRSWAGRVPVHRFARIADLVGADATTVDVRLDFGLDDEGRCRVRGSARLSGGVACQRCARTVPHTLEVDVDLVVIAHEADARALTPRYDTCVLEEPKVAIDALIEDDLLLGLPAYGCVRGDACPHVPVAAGPEPAPSEPEQPGQAGAGYRRNSPFAVLATLASKGDSAGNAADPVDPPRNPTHLSG